jgi:hypothetical protein
MVAGCCQRVGIQAVETLRWVAAAANEWVHIEGTVPLVVIGFARDDVQRRR